MVVGGYCTTNPRITLPGGSSLLGNIEASSLDFSSQFVETLDSHAYVNICIYTVYCTHSAVHCTVVKHHYVLHSVYIYVNGR